MIEDEARTGRAGPAVNYDSREPLKTSRSGHDGDLMPL